MTSRQRSDIKQDPSCRLQVPYRSRRPLGEIRSLLQGGAIPRFYILPGQRPWGEILGKQVGRLGGWLGRFGCEMLRWDGMVDVCEEEQVGFMLFLLSGRELEGLAYLVLLDR